MANNDSIYFEGKAPEVVYCIMHPEIIAEKRSEKGPMYNFKGISYGVCGRCVVTLDKKPGYQANIDMEIGNRVRNMNQRLENFNGVV